MSKKQREKRVSGVGRRTLTKAMLLPPPAESARAVSLRNHLTLAACRGGAGNTELLGELFVVSSLSWFLREAGYGDAPDSLYVEIQDALERCVILNATDMNWRIDELDAEVLCKLLACYDRQFVATPLHLIEGAKRQMRRSASGDWLFPWTGR